MYLREENQNIVAISGSSIVFVIITIITIIIIYYIHMILS